jgi:hypothetical protein
MPPGLRKLALTAHVTSSVGWLGAAAAYVAIAVAGTAHGGPSAAAYAAMDQVGRLAIVPLCLAALATGLVQALGTEWGLVRHWWIVAKLALTAVATVVLLVHMPTVTRMAQSAVETSPADSGPVGAQFVVHAVGGVVVLLATTALSIYKPWGRTPYGRGKATSEAAATATASATSWPWRRIALLAPCVVVLVFLVLHLAAGGMHHH